jgi:hypothetical protein
MYVKAWFPLAWLSLAAALPALHEINDVNYSEITSGGTELQKRQRSSRTPDVESIAGPIGLFMSMATSMSGVLGIDVKGDMTTTLCKQFQDGGAMPKAIEAFAGSPNGKGPDEKCVKDTSGGSGPYNSKVYEDPTLANHTIYIPAKPLPQGQKLPVIAWANGFCLPAGTMFENFLRELASFGYMVIANGKINHNGQLGGTTRSPELIKSIDWVVKNPKVKDVPNEVDIDKIVIAGQSCGGVNVYGAINDKRIKYAMMFNSGDFAGQSSELIKGIKVPVAYFEGGKSDFAAGPVSSSTCI